MNAADIQPVLPAAQTQSTVDLFLIFVGANVVATTFQVGASLSSSFSLATTMMLVAVGSVAGAALVAALAPLGPRLRVPSIIAARPALGFAGAALVAIALYASNFAWIALNNVIAASACVRVATEWLGPAAGSQTSWAMRTRPGRDFRRLARPARGGACGSHRSAAHDGRRRRADDRVRSRDRRARRGAADRDELVARPGRGHRVSGVVDPDVCGLLALHSRSPR